MTGLFNGAHHEVTRHALWLGARLEAASVRMGMLSLIHLWALKDEKIRDAFGFSAAARRRVQAIAPAPVWPPSAGPEGSLGRELLEVVEQGLNAAWSELLVVEAVLTETAQAFDGEDPIHPETRVLLDDVKSFALKLAKDVEAMRSGYSLPEEPATAVVRLLGQLVRADNG